MTDSISSKPGIQKPGLIIQVGKLAKKKPVPSVTKSPQAGTQLSQEMLAIPPSQLAKTQDSDPDPTKSKETNGLLMVYHRNRYLAQSVLLEESELSGLVRTGLMFISLAVVSFFAWAFYFTIDEMAHASGQVISSKPVQHIQHLEGGIVQEIRVAERDLVQPGQILVRLDPQSAQTELNKMEADRVSLLAWQERLMALLEERLADFSGVSDHFSRVIESQKQLLQVQHEARENRRKMVKLKWKGFQSQIFNLIKQDESIKVRLKLAKEQYSVQKEGFDKGVTSRLDLVRSEQNINEAEGVWLRNLGQLVKIRKEQSENQNDLIRQEDEHREATWQELGKVTAQLSKVEESMAQLLDRVKRLDVVSPVHGIIQEMQIKTVRGILAPGSLIAEIVPIGPIRYAEVRIRSLDIGHVSLGQWVTVQVTAYDFARYGGIDGTLESISPSTFQEDQGVEPYYKGIIRLHKNHVGNNPKTNEILPGMMVQADIHTGSKTLMEYILKPIYASMDQAFRER